MKNVLYLILLMFLFCISMNADEEEKFDLGKNSGVFNNGFVEQKQISDTKFKKTVEQMKERALTRKQKKIREQVQPKEPAADKEHLKMFAQSQNPDDDLSQTLTVMIPVKAYNDEGKFITPGYYKLSCRKTDSGKYVLDLSQGNRRILSVEAKQTLQDLEQDTIQFCNAEIIAEGRIRLMYGSIDLNLVGYIYYDEN